MGIQEVVQMGRLEVRETWRHELDNKSDLDF
jgi:hypothetical protein